MSDTMTSRQRWLAAVRDEPLDRLPFWPKFLQPVRVNPAVAPLVVVSQSRRLPAGQDTIPAPRRRNTPDGLLALHFVPRTASPLRTGASWRPWRGILSLRIYPHRSRRQTSLTSGQALPPTSQSLSWKT